MTILTVSFSCETITTLLHGNWIPSLAGRPSKLFYVCCTRSLKVRTPVHSCVGNRVAKVNDCRSRRRNVDEQTEKDIMKLLYCF